MELKTKDFQEVAKTILMAANIDKTTNSLKLEVKDYNLFLSVTDREYFCSICFPLETNEDFVAVVEANLFLNLIANLTTDTFSLKIKDNTVIVEYGKSSYNLAMIYDNDKLMEIPAITIQNKTVDFNISNDILKSILNVNSKEMLKDAASASLSELQKYYYIDEAGCFTFKTGACLNEFTLQKPIKLLLTEKIIKLFKLFKDDVCFEYGYNVISNSSTQPVVVFKTDSIYVAAVLANDDRILAQVQGYCNATKKLINDPYTNHVVVSANTLGAAVARLLLFAKNNIKDQNSKYKPVTVSLTNTEILLTDIMANTEAVQIENDSFIDPKYSMIIDLNDLKLVLDSCKNDFVTINFGNKKSVVIKRTNISNLIPEGTTL